MDSFRESYDCKVLIYHVKQLLEIVSFTGLKHSQSIKFIPCTKVNMCLE